MPARFVFVNYDPAVPLVCLCAGKTVHAAEQCNGADLA
jgi:hypothetical protein